MKGLVAATCPDHGSFYEGAERVVVVGDTEPFWAVLHCPDGHVLDKQVTKLQWTSLREEGALAAGDVLAIEAAEDIFPVRRKRRWWRWR